MSERLIVNQGETQPTTATAYADIIATGLLGRAQTKVYRTLAERGPMTRNELDAFLAPGQPNPTFSRRLVELERMGAIERCLPRPCTVSGKIADQWRVTGRTPEKVEDDAPSKPTPDEIVRATYDLVTRIGFPEDLPEETVKLLTWLEHVARSRVQAREALPPRPITNPRGRRCRPAGNS